MNVKDLKAILRECDDDEVVVVASDPEGNSYHELDGAWSAAWDPEEREIGLREITDADRKEGYSEEDVLEGPPALVLVPK